MRSRVFTGVGLTLLVAAPSTLLLTGHTRIAVSADEEAGAVPLVVVVLPVLVGLLLVRLVPPGLPALPTPLAEHRRPLVRQAAGLVLVAVAFSAVSLALWSVPGGELLYGPVKLLFLLGAGWLLVRRWPAPSPAGRHRARIPARWYWLGPLPAVAAWGYLHFYSPLGGEQDLSGYEAWDPVELAVAALFTFVTASVAEELFYRVLLQTRLEALLGRWPAITATALLFAAMHVHRYGDGPFWEVTAVVLASNGGFGLFVGYLWARYRNPWWLIVVHGAVNALNLLPILLG
ncbi:CPBP family intramembrane glutamic endopeptidase [Plantactinospora sonchi]|uniref:Type II CAAX endopeptidase family protein n=1 Tax=Plantactinospora sonchi TaxID=1544735 RepID=A0ABU7RQQ0_9ACTN